MFISPILIEQAVLRRTPTDRVSASFYSDNPLAKGFLLTDGHVEITVPNVAPRDDYLIVCKFSHIYITYYTRHLREGLTYTGFDF